MYKHPRILPSVPKQDPGILPSVPKQDSPSAESSCDRGWTFFEDTRHCYVVSGHVKSWDEAQAHCELLNEKAHLVTIESDAENEFVLDLVKLIGRPKAWIGMKAALGWYDSSHVSYTNWASGEPEGQATNPCVWMYGEEEPQGFWKTDKCEVESDIGIVCKMPSNI